MSMESYKRKPQWMTGGDRANDLVSGENERREKKATKGARGVVKTITNIGEEQRR
jgi:hypothetical protein